MSTLKVNSIANNGSAVDLPNGAFNIGGNSILQGYTSSATEPASPATGDFWWDSANEELYQYLNSEFKAIGIAESSWAVSSSTYDNVSLSVASQDVIPFGITFNTTGTRLYIAGNQNDNIFQYDLSTAFDLSTASYNNVSFSVSNQTNVVTDVNFNSNGSIMYIGDYTNQKVLQYSLSTAFNVSTASYNNVSFSVSSQISRVFCVIFNTTGTKMYVASDTPAELYQYTLSTAFNVSTASYDSVSFSFSSQDTILGGTHFNSDGTKMYMVGKSSDSVHQYSLSTAFDLSTASYDSVSFSVASQDVTPEAIRFSPDFTKMYISGNSNDTIYQYSTNI